MKKIITSMACVVTAIATPVLAQEASDSGIFVDPDAFTENKRTLRKSGVTVGAAQLLPIRPGVVKDTIYTLIGPPHFGEGITRRWNFVIFIAGQDPQPMRCRLRIDFGRPKDGYNVVVRKMTWSSEECREAASAS